MLIYPNVLGRESRFVCFKTMNLHCKERNNARDLENLSPMFVLKHICSFHKCHQESDKVLKNIRRLELFLKQLIKPNCCQTATAESEKLATLLLLVLLQNGLKRVRL